MSNNPTHKKEWQDLIELHKNHKDNFIANYFKNNPKRANDFSITLNGLHYDYSKNHITEGILKALITLAEKSGVIEAREKLFSGDIVNKTENRAALHTHLRKNFDHLTQANNIASQIRNAKWQGVTGKAINHIVHIGLGGSELGPRMLLDALKQDAHSDISISFLSSIDGAGINDILQDANPETTLFIIVSKSFKTQETIINAQTAVKWLQTELNDTKALHKHCIGITANKAEALQFGLSEDNIIEFDNSVNGRFSLWSSVSLSILIAIGSEKFQAFLEGGAAIDQHFYEEKFKKNIPIVMALIDIWNRNFCGYNAKVIAPYAQELKKLPTYLQQLEMESNGKNCDLDGTLITEYKTASIIFGEVGTNVQHSFFQMLHQGTDIIPCDFIAAIKPNHMLNDHHKLLLNNMLAQSQALMSGNQSEEKHKHFDGNRPSSVLLLNKIDSYHLGMLIALYEHKVFVQSIIWNINCFDQFGVELGKDITKKIERNDFENADPSTINLHRIINR